MRVRRSELTTPGSSTKMMEKAANSNADQVMLDLEDAVAPSEKEAARGKIVDAIRDFDWGEKTVSVRINDLDHPNASGDLTAVVEGAGDRLDVIIVPKIERGEDVYVVDKLLGQLEAAHDVEGTIGIETLIEEVQAVQNVDDIAAASDRMEALIFGPADYSASQGVNLQRVDPHLDRGNYPGDIWHYVRNRIVVAARANGIDAIDGPFGDIEDTEGYREEARHAMAMGFVGKWAIHPAQIRIANEVYSPTEDEVERARKIVTAMEEGAADGRGAVSVDGEMIDEASIRAQQRVLDRAKQIGMVE